LDLLKDDRGVQIKLPESEGSESREGSTEGTEYSKQNSYVRSDTNIQDNYKKLYNNTTNSNNINIQMVND
jgi:hypothetical protein